MKPLLMLLISTLAFTACAQKNQPGKNDISVGGSCEGCEAIYESPVAFAKLSWIDTLPDFNDSGPKMEVTGIIYQLNGQPAANIILYIYHTDQTGVYPKKGNETGWDKRHGYIRGWIKTNEKGQYKFYTLKPGAYPDRQNPEHIHPTIKEPGKKEYYIDEYLFDDDPLLTKSIRERQEQRGGTGIIKLKKINDRLFCERNIYLGRNIPGYPSN